MRKKNKGILILLAALVLLLAAYFGLRTWNVRQEEKEEEEQEAAAVHVTDTSSGDIASFKFNVGNGDLEFHKEGDGGTIPRIKISAETELSGRYGRDGGKYHS